MNDNASREIIYTYVGKPSTTPDPMGQGVIYQEAPCYYEMKNEDHVQSSANAPVIRVVELQRTSSERMRSDPWNGCRIIRIITGTFSKKIQSRPPIIPLVTVQHQSKSNNEPEGRKDPIPERRFEPGQKEILALRRPA